MNIEIRRSNRKTMALEVTYEAKVIVRAPYYMPQAEIERFVLDKASWIEKSIARVKKRQTERADGPQLSEEDIARLTALAKDVIPAKVAYYAEIIGVTYGRITIRHQKSMWCSCSGKGNLNFNCLLMLAPEAVQDYVVVHELCHRKEMNHSDKFWREVEKILPDYRAQRKWLKEYGSTKIDGI